MKLVVMGDLHFSRMQNGTTELLAAREVFYNAMLNKFFEIEADYHISLGDITNEGYAEEFQYLFDKVNSHELKRHFIQVLGNHDTISIPKTEILAITGQHRYHAIDSDEAVLVFLDTAKEMDLRDFGGELGAEQAAWLDDVVQKSGDKPLFIFAHHPVYATTARSEINMLSIHPDQDIWPALQKKAGFGYYFCGHNHVNSIVQRAHWHFIQTSACLDIPAFRVIDIEEGKVSVNMIFIEDEQLLQLAKLIGENMVYFNLFAGAKGDKSDHALIVEHAVS